MKYHHDTWGIFVQGRLQSGYYKNGPAQIADDGMVLNGVHKEYEYASSRTLCHNGGAEDEQA